MQQLMLGTGTAIWWLTEPHWQKFAQSGHPDSVTLLTLIRFGVKNKLLRDQNKSGNIQWSNLQN